MIFISIFETAWDNFDSHHEKIWEYDNIPWEEYCKPVLVKYDARLIWHLGEGDTMGIRFSSEEGHLLFLLEWA